MNASWHISMCHVTSEWVMTYINDTDKQYHLCHDIYKWIKRVVQHMSRYRLKDFHKGQRVLSQMNESCHIWMCHGAHEGVMVHVNESCHIRRTQYHAFQVMTTLWHIWMNLGRYECVMANIWMCHGTYEWVLSQMNESWHIWMSRGTYERHTRAIPHMTTYRLSRRSTNHARYGWVMPHMKESWYTWMNHVTYDGVISHMHE